MKTKYDIFTFGSVTLDIFLTPSFADIEIVRKRDRDVFQFPVGEKIKVSEVMKMCGGGAANTATGFAKLGLRAGIVGVIGDDEEGHLICEKLKKTKIDTRFLCMEKGGTSSFSIILMAPDGRRTVFHDRTTKEDFSRKTLRDIPPARAIYIGHLYKKSADMLDEIPAWKKKNRGFVAWNPGKTQFESGFKAFEKIFPCVDLLIVNREEAEYFTKLKAKKLTIKSPGLIGRKVIAGSEVLTKEIFDVRALAQKFMRTGVQTVVITDCKNGAQLFTQHQHLWCPSPKVKIASTLGAGDAFSVGIVAALLHEKSAEEQLRWATASAGSVIQKFGAQEGQATMRTLREFLK